MLLLYPDTLAGAERLVRRLHLFTLDGAFVRDARLPAGPFYVAADGRIFRVSAALQTLQVWHNGVVRDLGGAWGLPRTPITAAERDSVVQAKSAISIYRGIRPLFADQRTVLGSVVVAPDGEVWVELTAPREGKLVYRVIQSDGHHRHDVAPPPGATVVGVGRNHLFLARSDENGEQELLRAPRP